MIVPNFNHRVEKRVIIRFVSVLLLGAEQQHPVRVSAAIQSVSPLALPGVAGWLYHNRQQVDRYTGIDDKGF